ncbi:MAG: hypothetical protein AB7N80_13825 [Bdellovibrionales bacterium]
MRGKFLAAVVLWPTFVLLQTSCTSIQLSDYKQPIKVTSLKPGAEIRHKGQLLGTTPAFVYVRRHRHPKLDLNYPGQPAVRYSIKTKYRWGESFAPSLFGAFLAPAFIILDLNTGTAWNLREATNIDVPGQSPVVQSAKFKTVSLAPPQAANVTYSDQLALHLEKYFAHHPGWKLRPFKETVGMFEDSQYTYKAAAVADRSALFADIASSHIVESWPSCETKGKLDYVVRNVYTNQIEEAGTLDLPRPERKAFGFLKEFVVGVVPNTITLDAASRAFEVEKRDGTIISTEAEPLAGWLGDFSRFVGSFSLTNLIPPGRGRVFEAHTRLVSSLDVNFSQFRFSSADFNFNDTTYKLARGTLAIGPQGYLETALGLFYADLMVGPSYSRIEWNGANAGKTEGGSVASILNFGYYRYFTNRIAFRLFVRRISEDFEKWDRVLDRSQNVDVPAKGVASLQGGMSLAFYFPEAGRKLRH